MSGAKKSNAGNDAKRDQKNDVKRDRKNDVGNKESDARNKESDDRKKRGESNMKNYEKKDNPMDDMLLKEALSEYAERELTMLERETNALYESAAMPSEGESASKAGTRLDKKMKRTFWYYGGGGKRLFAIGSVCAAAAALLLGLGIWNMQTGRDRENGADVASSDLKTRDNADMQYEVYMDYYGEGATLSYASAQSQSKTEGVLPEEMAALPELQGGALGIHTDAETAVRNSNYKNFGYLCTDGRGMIYYSDMTERAIYASREDGSGRVKLADGAGYYLQERDGNLYYIALDEGSAIMRLNIATGEKTIVMDEPHGEFILTDEGLLVNAESGVLLLGYEGGEAQIIEAMSDKDWQPALFTASDEMVLFNAVQGTDVNYYLQGHLLCYDRSREEVFYLGRQMMRPLLAGDWLLAVKGESKNGASLHVMDLAAGTDTDLGVWPYDGFVSDGTVVYYTRGGLLGRYQDGVNEEILNLHEQESELMGQCPDRYLYLAGDYFYWLCRRQVIEGEEVAEIFYEWHCINMTE